MVSVHLANEYIHAGTPSKKHGLPAQTVLFKMLLILILFCSGQTSEVNTLQDMGRDIYYIILLLIAPFHNSLLQSLKIESSFLFP